jgi:hypothetical protein
VRWVLRFVVGVTLVAAGACSTFGADSSDAPGPAADAGEDGTSGGDGSLSDGSVGDAGSDVADDGDGGSVSPCRDGRHWLCDDFDRDAAALFPTWGSVLLAGEGGVSIDALASAPSAPNVLTARARGNDGAQLASVHAGTATTLHCELDLLVEQRSATETLLVVLDVSNSVAKDYYRVELRGGAPDYILVYGAVNGVPLSGTSTSASLGNAWRHVVLELRAGATQEVHVGIDGTPIVDNPALDAGLATPTTQSVTIGVASFAGAGGWAVRYDNVFCDALP